MGSTALINICLIRTPPVFCFSHLLTLFNEHCHKGCQSLYSTRATLVLILSTSASVLLFWTFISLEAPPKSYLTASTPFSQASILPPAATWKSGPLVFDPQQEWRFPAPRLFTSCREWQLKTGYPIIAYWCLLSASSQPGL